MQSYAEIFYSVWKKRGLSDAAVDRMWELHQKGVSDQEKINTLKAEGLWQI